MIARPLALHMLTILMFGQPVQPIRRSIRRISPQITAGIRTQQLLKNLAVMHIAAGYLIRADQLVFHIHTNVVFVAKVSIVRLGFCMNNFLVLLTLRVRLTGLHS